MAATGCGGGLPPAIEVVAPRMGQNLIGVSAVTLQFDASASTTIELATVLIDETPIDGVELSAPTFDAQGTERRRIEAVWDTTDADLGSHLITGRVLDADARIASVVTMVTLVPAVIIRSVQTSSTGDEPPGAPIDLEVHIWGMDGGFAGCAAAASGLTGGQRFDGRAFARSPSGSALPYSPEPVTVTVIENDDEPCPAPVGPEDDVLGVAAPQILDASTPMAFGAVSNLVIGPGRLP